MGGLAVATPLNIVLSAFYWLLPYQERKQKTCIERKPRPPVSVSGQRLERRMSQTVAELLVDVLQHIGVKQIFGLIGDSLNPLADAVKHSKIEWIGVRHEEGAALAASGQAKLTCRLAVCAGTTGPGSTPLVAGLYEAARDHAPVLALSGDMPRKMQGVDYIQ